MPESSGIGGIVEISQEEADRLVRLRARFRRVEPAEVRELLGRAFPMSRQADEGALRQAEDLFIYLQLRARWANQLQFTDCVRPIENAVRSWFEERHVTQ